MKFLIPMLLFLFSCGGDLTPDEIVKPLRSDSKLAYTIKKYQTTTCKNSCLVEKKYWYDNCYEDKEVDPKSIDKAVESSPDVYYCTDKNGNKLPDCLKKCVKECPLKYVEFLCIDLQKEEGQPNRRYSIKPYEWQRDVSFLAGYYFHSQIKKLIAQPEFMCEQDFAICENHFEPIQTLKKFIHERSK